MTEVVIALLALLGTVFTGLVAFSIARLNAKLVMIAAVANDTHTLVNSAMGTQLKLHAITARAKADLRPDDEADKKVAELAESMLRDYLARQKVLDRSGR